MKPRLWAILLCGVWAAAAQSDPGPTVRLFGIRQHMKQRLLEVPNYTCLETVERSERAKPSGKFKKLDTVRMEVAEVNGKELFARPGQQFDQSNPGAFTHRGAMAGGIFVMFANALFIGESAKFEFAGDEEVGKRKLARYTFEMPRARSGYTIWTPSRSAVVAYHGSAWADLENLDVLHLRIVAGEIPPELGLTDAGIEIEYQVARIGSSDALLPKHSDMLLTEFSGMQKRNVTTFSACRQYGSDSVVSFETEGVAKPGK